MGLVDLGAHRLRTTAHTSLWRENEYRRSTSAYANESLDSGLGITVGGAKFVVVHRVATTLVALCACHVHRPTTDFARDAACIAHTVCCFSDVEDRTGTPSIVNFLLTVKHYSVQRPVRLGWGFG